MISAIAPVRDYLLDLQGRIIAAFEAEDGRPFVLDQWQREPGGKLEGEGRTRNVFSGIARLQGIGGHGTSMPDEERGIP